MAKKFGSFNLGRDSVYDIGDGVIRDIAGKFGFELADEPDPENLSALRAVIAPERELQRNIAYARDVLGKDADKVAISWVEKTGLLEPVNRNFEDPNHNAPKEPSATVITGAVVRWTDRRVKRYLDALRDGELSNGRLILAGGSRVIGEAEGKPEAVGMTEAEYLEEVRKSLIRVIGSGAFIDVIAVDSKVGDDIMSATVESLDDVSGGIVVSSNAGAWVQNAGQFRRAL